MNILTCPLVHFQQVLADLAAAPARALYVGLGLCHRDGDHEWLMGPQVDAGRAHSLPTATSLMCVTRAASPPMPPDPWPSGVAAELVLGADTWAGHWWGYARQDGVTFPLHELRLVGTGMHRLPSLGTPPTLPHAPLEAHERWSRTAGALGGADVRRRLVRLNVAVVGCGRSGSVAAEQLARLGVAELTLIDPDRVELHNVGEMALVTPDDVGRPKAQALAAALAGVTPTRTVPLTTPLHDPATRAVAARADLIVSTVDNDSARLSAALLATVYHRLLLDIGAGIHTGADRGREMGADVRLMVPGDGCLLCCGHVADYTGALRELGLSPGGTHPNWQAQRTGSLASLNHLAVAAGMRLLEDLVAGRVTGSRWSRLSFDPAGALEVRYPAWRRDAGCPLCARTGVGDAAFDLAAA